MAGLRHSLAHLKTLRVLFEERLGAASRRERTPSFHPEGRLRLISRFGTNPGNLRMHAYFPDRLPFQPALVVALHGCTQDANSFDRGTGWSILADRLGLVVIYPEQQAANNPKTCFSWFLPGDTARDRGEALSIRQMIETAISEFGVDRRRMFITGLSAGGAMANVMLATYPEVFAGGAIIAGLPYGSAASVQEAFEAMFSERAPSSRALGDQVRAASQHRGPWPKISVWHGTADAVVKPSNADHTIKQWLNVQGLSERPCGEEQIGRHVRRTWSDATGDVRIESFTVAGMRHGVPLAAGDANSCGQAGPFFVEAGVASTWHIADFWGLCAAEAPVRTTQRARDIATSAILLPAQSAARSAGPHPDTAGQQGSNARLDPNAVIAAAFQAAGLPAPAGRVRPSASEVNPRGIIDAALKAAGLKLR
jgi:poly(hydroxyalkanoate) depolymerase family esterase